MNWIQGIHLSVYVLLVTLIICKSIFFPVTICIATTYYWYIIELLILLSIWVFELFFFLNRFVSNKKKCKTLAFWKNFARNMASIFHIIKDYLNVSRIVGMPKRIYYFCFSFEIYFVSWLFWSIWKKVIVFIWLNFVMMINDPKKVFQCYFSF